MSRTIQPSRETVFVPIERRWPGMAGLTVRRKCDAREDSNPEDDVSVDWRSCAVVGWLLPPDLCRFHAGCQGREHRFYGWGNVAVVHTPIVSLGGISFSWRSTFGESVWPEALIWPS